jgi:hypothetical protein
MPVELAGDIHQREQRRSDHEGGRERRAEGGRRDQSDDPGCGPGAGRQIDRHETVQDPWEWAAASRPGARRDRLVGDGQLDGPSVDARTDTDSLGSLQRDLNE